jgi:hypothetical protein
VRFSGFIVHGKPPEEQYTLHRWRNMGFVMAPTARPQSACRPGPPQPQGINETVQRAASRRACEEVTMTHSRSPGTPIDAVRFANGRESCRASMLG